MPDLSFARRSLRATPFLGPLLSPVGLTILGLAQLTDFLTFRVMVGDLGPGSELNPVALALHDHGMLAALSAKLAVWALVAAIAAVLAPHHPRTARFVVAFGIVAGLVGAFSNLLTL